MWMHLHRESGTGRPTAHQHIGQAKPHGRAVMRRRTQGRLGVIALLMPPSIPGHTDRL